MKFLGMSVSEAEEQEPDFDPPLPFPDDCLGFSVCCGLGFVMRIGGVNGLMGSLIILFSFRKFG